jgi:hypothetical protein
MSRKKVLYDRKDFSVNPSDINSQPKLIVEPTGTIFCDIDGTLVEHGSGNPILKNIRQVNDAYDKGWLVILTTLRGNKNWPENSLYNQRFTLMLLQRCEIKYHHIIWDSPSPRIVINDEGARAIQPQTNQEFELWPKNVIA